MGEGRVDVDVAPGQIDMKLKIYRYDGLVQQMNNLKTMCTCMNDCVYVYCEHEHKINSLSTWT